MIIKRKRQKKNRKRKRREKERGIGAFLGVYSGLESRERDSLGGDSASRRFAETVVD